MKKTQLVLLLVIITYIGNAQTNYRRLSFVPHYSLGISLPGQIVQERGDYFFQNKITPISATGTDDSGNQSNLPIVSTHKWGLSADYRILPNVSLRGGFNRTQYIYVYSHNYNFEITGNIENNGFVNLFKFNSFNMGLKLGIKKIHVVLGLELIPDMFQYLDPNVIDGESYRGSNPRQGIDFSYNDLVPQTYQLNLQVGSQSLLFGESLRWFLSANYNPSTIGKMGVNFIDNNRSIGSNLIDVKANGIFFGAELALRFKKKANTRNAEKEDNSIKELERKLAEEKARKEKKELDAKRDEEAKLANKRAQEEAEQKKKDLRLAKQKADLEAKQKAELEAEQKKKAEKETKLKAELEAEQKRKAEKEAEKLRIEEENRKKEEERKKLAEGKNIEIGDKKIAIGEKLVLNAIQFEQSKAVLKPEAIQGLEEVLAMLKKYPSIRIEITGHTSTEGVRSDNIELSKLRAEACKDYLVKKGISAKRIVAFGIGPDRPISNTNQQLNRRVEMKVLGVD
ncbi:MAG: OmpA family protein [Leadbetterella sp.]